MCHNLGNINLAIDNEIAHCDNMLTNAKRKFKKLLKRCSTNMYIYEQYYEQNDFWRLKECFIEFDECADLISKALEFYIKLSDLFEHFRDCVDRNTYSRIQKKIVSIRNLLNTVKLEKMTFYRLIC